MCKSWELLYVAISKHIYCISGDHLGFLAYFLYLACATVSKNIHINIDYITNMENKRYKLKTNLLAAVFPSVFCIIIFVHQENWTAVMFLLDMPWRWIVMRSYTPERQFDFSGWRLYEPLVFFFISLFCIHISKYCKVRNTTRKPLSDCCAYSWPLLRLRQYNCATKGEHNWKMTMIRHAKFCREGLTWGVWRFCVFQAKDILVAAIFVYFKGQVLNLLK